MGIDLDGIRRDAVATMVQLQMSRRVCGSMQAASESAQPRTEHALPVDPRLGVRCLNRRKPVRVIPKRHRATATREQREGKVLRRSCVPTGSHPSAVAIAVASTRFNICWRS